MTNKLQNAGTTEHFYINKEDLIKLLGIELRKGQRVGVSADAGMIEVRIFTSPKRDD